MISSCRSSWVCIGLISLHVSLFTFIHVSNIANLDSISQGIPLESFSFI